MLNKAILELNGIFNINKASSQQNQPLEPLQRQETVSNGYVHPILTNEDLKSTMNNYRKYVDNYDKQVWKENIFIDKYNEDVEKYRKEKPLQRQEEIKLIKFYKSISSFDVRERNTRIEDFNRLHGTIAKKERIQTLKDPSEKVFSVILWHYQMQLFKRRDNFKELNVFTPASMPFVELHSAWITGKTVDGVKRLRYCKRTFYRHRDRLKEAGVLQDYRFEGSARPVKAHINPKILVVTDNAASKKAATENQSVTSGGATKSQDNNVSNRTYLNKSEIKANVDNQHSDIRSSLPLTALNFSSTRTPESKVQKKTTPAPKNSPAPEKIAQNKEKITPVAEKMTWTDYFRLKIEDPDDFAQNLAAHKYIKYTPLPKEALQKEAYNGGLTREEFKELVIQDFFKISSKNWKGKSPYAGSWRKAYNTWMREKFLTPNGYSQNKHNIAARVPELRYRLEKVRRYCKKHPEFQLLFPGEYFDVTRTTAKEGGFEYTAKAWKKHQDYLQSKKDAGKEAVATARNRKRRLTDYQKVEKHVKNYLKDKFDLQELFTKVEQIGNRQLSAQLPEIIKKANVEFQAKFL